MPVSRRSFLKSASAGGIGALSIPLIAARGSEGAREPLHGLFGGASPEVGGRFAWEERAAARLAAPDAIRLDSNENPNGPGRAALEAVRAMFGETPRYPDTPSTELQRAIASHHRIPADHVIVGCGSGEILRMASYAFTGPGAALLTAAPSFEDPVRHSQMMGAPITAVPVDSALRLDLDRMLDESRSAGMVFLCNPNNPTGTVHGGAAVRDFIAAVHRRNPGCVIMVDEAYHEYVDDPGYASMLPLAVEDPKVIVVRTFSKVYGMAGLRAGYVVGRPETLRQMQRYRLPNSVNVLAAAAAISTLPDTAHLEREKQLNHAARAFTVKALDGMGFKAAPSNTNFIMVPIGRSSVAFKDACAKHGVLVGRPFPPLDNHARISIGTMEEMKKAVEVFKQVLSASAN